MCILGYYMLFGSLSQDEREVIVTSHGLLRDTKCSINSFYILGLDVFIFKCFMENLKSWFGDLTGGRGTYDLIFSEDCTLHLKADGNVAIICILHWWNITISSLKIHNDKRTKRCKSQKLESSLFIKNFTRTHTASSSADKKFKTKT